MANENLQILRSVGILVLGFAAAFGGMVARERVSLTATESPLNSLVASRDLEPIPEDDYFTELAKLIEKDFVDPIEDEMKLATGAVRGMIGSLDDLNSIYYDKEDFGVVRRSLAGQYEGIGADLAFQYPPKKGNDEAQSIPRVVVLSLVPGGPADRAGIRVGDWVDTVDERWVVNSVFLDHARTVQEKVQAKTLPATALIEIRRELRKKAEDAIPPMRAWKRLAVGKTGSVAVRMYRGTQLLDFELQKDVSTRKVQDGYQALAFLPGSNSKLELASDSIRFDLRGRTGGDFQASLDLLEKLGASGKIGQLKRGERAALPVLLKSSVPMKSVEVLVDRQTRGVPEAFAMALKQKGATVVGTSAGDPVATEVAQLPDGSGFTLNLGKFEGAKR